MPGFDGTGPLGQGPMTGGGFGYCGTGRTFYGRFAGGRGPGFGRGRWLGRRVGTGYRRPWGPYGWPQVMDTKTELAQLKQEADDVNAYLKDVEARIAEIEKTSE